MGAPRSVTLRVTRSTRSFSSADRTLEHGPPARYEMEMRSRLFHAVIVGGLAIATPLASGACSSDDSRGPTTVDAAGAGAADVDADASAHGDGAHDAAFDADGGWPPTK